MNEPMTSTLQTRQASRRAVLRGFAGSALTAALMAAGWTAEAANPPAYQIDGATSGDTNPLNIVFLFGHPDDPDVFEDYYLNTHVPLALRIPGFERLDGCRAISDAEGNLPAFYRMATLSFRNRADMEVALASKEGLAAFADVANFATGGVTATIVNDLQSRTRTVASSPSLDDPREP